MDKRVFLVSDGRASGKPSVSVRAHFINMKPPYEGRRGVGCKYRGIRRPLAESHCPSLHFFQLKRVCVPHGAAVPRRASTGFATGLATASPTLFVFAAVESFSPSLSS